MSNIVLEGSTDSLIAIEVHRIISLMPKWQPAMKGGKIVRSQVKLPVSFNSDASVSTNRFDYQGYDAGIILAFSYEKAFSLGTLGKYLNDGHGASIDFHFLDDDYDDDQLGLGIYSTWIRLWAEQPFERRNTIWQSGRRLSFNEVGVKLSYRIYFFENKQLEIFPTFQAAPSWYRPVERDNNDSGLGIGDVGLTYGFALRANWFFGDTSNDNYHVLHFNLCNKLFPMTAPIKGSMITIGIGYTWFINN
ncbi:MAG: hypothetical protein IPH31_10475 [Lewinellaceae bacterium]|nr:hypothetical protein [Lewinellaceae bacterium]